jgi:hypothetical protein
MRHELLPEVPPVYEAFDDAGAPILNVHRAYGEAVRSVMSPATFAAGQLSQKGWLRTCMPNPDGGEPISALHLRGMTGEDLEDPITPQHWEHVSVLSAQVREELEGATSRLNLIARTLQVAVLDDRIQTFARPIGGCVEKAEKVEAAFWEMDNPLPRLAWCGFDIAHPLDPTRAPTHWLFVDRAQLLKEQANLERVEFFDPGPAVPKPEGYSEKVIQDVSSRLLEAFASDMTGMTKEGFRDLIQAERGRAVSRTNWIFAWREAAAKHPNRSKPGRPKKRTKSIR